MVVMCIWAVVHGWRADGCWEGGQIFEDLPADRDRCLIVRTRTQSTAVQRKSMNQTEEHQLVKLKFKY